ncbi:family 3 adenylate cyclase [Candidatus Magnetobacterium bavaricum]|uniref:Family 3 adenylate cyclase n=1 Tax=Candidatus Magnetobacterium bavaricum TaxID=29290 RepID=A0A0F3GXG1_9BACT|nr:family 3 adenylate cyclase [Candidatus Magnetobacterium bavaricum]
MKITLRKLIARKEVYQLLNSMITHQGLNCCIKDLDGKVLVGNNNIRGGVTHDITVEERPVGYLVGDQSSLCLLTFVDYLVNDELARRALGSEVLDKYKKISLLYDISQTINSGQPLVTTAENILKGAQKLIASSAGSIMLINNKTNVLEVIAAFGEKNSENIELKHGIGIAGHVLQSGKIELVNDVSSDPRFIKGNNNSVAGLICAPLKIKDKVIGVFNMSRVEPVIYTAEDMKIFSIVSSQASMALENSVWHQYKEDTDKIKDNLGQYISPQIFKAIANPGSNDSLKPTKENVTILFADIRNFSGICEELPPEEIVKYLNEYFRHMTEIIFKNGGVVNKFVGDMVVSIFGAPTRYVDNEKRAVETAIRMQQRIESIDTEYIRERFTIGIGISSGEVIVGNIGSPKHMDYTAIGDDVNVADRLQSLAKPGQILVTRSVYEVTKRTFEFRNYQSIYVKGKKIPVEVFEVQYGK